jgi:Putative beta-lactamase-inhibitor-like, PepSY-like
MKRTIFLMSLISFTLFANESFSQKLREIPKAVEKTFSGQYNRAANIDYRDQLIGVDVAFELNGEKMIASYTNKGIWKETTKEWAFDKLPAEVKDGFQKSKYADRTIEETKLLYLPGDSTQYRIRVRKSDVEKKYLYFNTQGRLLRENMTL